MNFEFPADIRFVHQQARDLEGDGQVCAVGADQIEKIADQQAEADFDAGRGLRIRLGPDRQAKLLEKIEGELEL